MAKKRVMKGFMHAIERSVSLDHKLKEAKMNALRERVRFNNVELLSYEDLKQLDIELTLRPNGDKFYDKQLVKRLALTIRWLLVTANNTIYKTEGVSVKLDLTPEEKSLRKEITKTGLRPSKVIGPNPLTDEELQIFATALKSTSETKKYMSHHWMMRLYSTIRHMRAFR